MRILVRSLAVCLAVAFGPSSAFATSTVFGPDPLALYAFNGPDGYMAKTNSGEEFFFVGALGEFTYIPEDTFLPGIPLVDSWILSGTIVDGATYQIEMTFLDFDDVTQQWDTGFGEVLDTLGDLAFTIDLDGTAQLLGDTVFADIIVTGPVGQQGADLQFRLSSQVPEPTSAIVFGAGLLLVHSATRRRRAA